MSETIIRVATRALLESFEADEEVKRLQAALTAGGLTPCETLEVQPPDGPRLTARTFAEPDGLYYCAVVKSPVEGDYLQITSHFDDDTAITSTSAAQDDDEVEPYGLGESEIGPIEPANLIEGHLLDIEEEQKESGVEIVTIKPAEIRAYFTDDWRRMLDEAFETAPELASPPTPITTSATARGLASSSPG